MSQDVADALADVELPTPREDALASVEAVREFIHEHDGATRAAILEGLVPEENHPIGLNALQASRVGVTDGYRDWWWRRVVAPGLRALEDVETRQGTWQPVTDEGDEPEAGPQRWFEILSDPTAPPASHEWAVENLYTELVAGEDVGARFVPHLGRLLTRPSVEVEVSVLRCLRHLAKDHPEAVLEEYDRIVGRLSADGSETTEAATGCLVELAATLEPATFVDETPMLAALLDVDDERTRANAMYVLSRIARGHPEEVKPLVPRLIEAIEDLEGGARANALSALGRITSAYPSAALPAVDALVALTDADRPKVQRNALALLADIATGHPDAVAPHAEAILEPLNDDDEIVRGNATSVVIHLATEEPASVEAAVPALVELLDDPSPVVRRNVCKALAHLEATVALSGLRTRAEDDPDEGVRSLAGWAIERLTD